MSGEIRRYFMTRNGVSFDHYVLAPDYDRDTQALRDELDACKSPPGGCGYWREAARLREAERDELRAQLGAMRALMAEAVPALQHISDTAQDIESFTLAERFRLVLQAKT